MPANFIQIDNWRKVASDMGLSLGQSGGFISNFMGAALKDTASNFVKNAAVVAAVSAISFTAVSLSGPVVAGALMGTLGAGVLSLGAKAGGIAASAAASMLVDGASKKAMQLYRRQQIKQHKPEDAAQALKRGHAENAREIAALSARFTTNAAALQPKQAMLDVIATQELENLGDNFGARRNYARLADMQRMQIAALKAEQKQLSAVFVQSGFKQAPTIRTMRTKHSFTPA